MTDEGGKDDGGTKKGRGRTFHPPELMSCMFVCLHFRNGRGRCGDPTPKVRGPPRSEATEGRKSTQYPHNVVVVYCKSKVRVKETTKSLLTVLPRTSQCRPLYLVTCWVLTLCVVRKWSVSCSTTQS